MGLLTAYATFAFAVSVAMTAVYRRCALRFGYVEQPRDDRWHVHPTPAVGGPAIATALCLGVVVFEPLHSLWLPLSCVAFVFVIGLVDDVRPLNASTKLVMQIAVASVLLSVGHRLGWVESLTLDTMLTLVWIIGITNAFNLLDNMDGLSAGVAIIAGLALLASFDFTMEAPPQVGYLALLLGAVAGFFVHNVHPARAFLGDSGSLLIGLSLAVMALEMGAGLAVRSDVVSIVAVPVLILLIPIVDATLVTVSRTMAGLPASQGGRDHSSHRLVAIGLSERAAVAVLWGLAAAGGLLGFAIQRFGGGWLAVVAALFLVAVAIFAVYLFQIRVYEGSDPWPQGNRVTPLLTNFLYKRRVAEVLLDVGLIAIGYYLAYRLRFEGTAFVAVFPTFLSSLPVVLGLQVLALYLVGGYRGAWHQFGLMDGVVFVQGTVLGTALAALGMPLLFPLNEGAPSVFIIYGVLLTLLLVASRASFRLIDEFIQRRRHQGERLVIYGAGRAGGAAIRELLGSSDSRYRMIGFLDDDMAKHRRRLHGYTVLGGFADLVQLVETGSVDTVVVSIRLIDGARLHAIRQLCDAHGVTLSRFHFELRQVAGGKAGA